jgi:hypothetical protein
VTNRIHSYALIALYLLGSLLLGSAAVLYWSIYNEGWYSGFAEGEEHEHGMAEEASRGMREFHAGSLDRCVENCTARGYPSLNAFYVANRARCMCQDVNQPDDIHGFFVLVPER